MAKSATNPWVVLVLICFAQFMVILDATIVNVALPSIQRDLNLSEGSLQWIVNAYTLVFGGFLLLGGRAGDLLGRKRLFLIGLVIFTGASLFDGGEHDQREPGRGDGVEHIENLECAEHLRASLPGAALAPLPLCTDNAAMIASAARYVAALPYPQYLDRKSVV